MASRMTLVAFLTVGLCAVGRPAAGQAWAPRAGQTGVTFVTQMIDHIGRINGDLRLACCGTTNVAVLVDVDYGITNRWWVSGGLPYVFAKYRGGDPKDSPFPWLPYQQVDKCHCLHSSFQDLSLGAHYTVVKVRRAFSLATALTFGDPTHNYEYAGEAVVGFRLRELGLESDAGQRLDFVVPGLSIEGHYAYTIAEKSLNISHNRSNVRFSASQELPKGFSGHLVLSWQRTHGGLRFPDDIEPYPERYTEFHRLLRDNYFQAGAGVSYVWGDWELSGSFLKTVSGTDTHDVHVYTLTAGRAFRFHRS